MDIRIKGARMHNLQEVNVDIPKGKWTVITGLSGSGKSSLAFDTLYAEGQRRYVESLSSYARQFLGRLDKPDVDSIDGITPAIAIEQRTSVGGPRSTVGTRTEIHDYLRMLYARIGTTISPISGDPVKRDRPDDVVARILEQPEGSRFYVLAALADRPDRTWAQQLDLLSQQGFSRIMVEGEVRELGAGAADTTGAADPARADFLVVDRLAVTPDSSEFLSRLGDSLETAFFEGQGECVIHWVEGGESEAWRFNDRFEKDGMAFVEPSPALFAFNSPVGACKRCEGFGQIIGIDTGRVIPDGRKSIYDDAIAPWRSDRMTKWKQQLILAAESCDIPLHTAWDELDDVVCDRVWNGVKGKAGFKGLDAFFADLEKRSYKIQYRVMLSRYRGKTRCTECKGTRICKEASYVKVGGTDLGTLLDLPVSDVLEHLIRLKLTKTEQTIGKRLLKEATQRLSYLCDVGLGYLTLSRQSNTLSGGEAQRIALSTCLGSSLVGSTYILDEPSIGLHPRDTARLIDVLKGLRDLGNTVVVVEHDDLIMAAADHLIDIGPYAGSLGGRVVFSGNHAALRNLGDSHESLTADYLTGKRRIALPEQRRKSSNRILLRDANLHNIKSTDAEIPLHSLVAVTGVSGSGKSTLVTDILMPLLKANLEGIGEANNPIGRLEGSWESVASIESVNQNPIGKSSRSNPVTYVKAFDEIRALLSETNMAKARGFKPAFFSFNIPGGRCERCEGEGVETIGMQFMADLKLRCPECKGKRYQNEILEVKWQGMNIDDVLCMTVDDAIASFTPLEGTKSPAAQRRLVAKLTPLQKVGLGYITLGQSSSTLSGGEAQRIKLASILARGDKQQHTLFLFDEPTTGLHVHDVAKLLDAFHSLIEQGHSIVVIEHQIDVIAAADWIIEMGPGGGENGGSVCFQGPPEAMIDAPETPTQQYLKTRLKG